MERTIPPEDIEAMMRGPHFKGAEGKAAESKYLFEGMFVDKGEVTPIAEVGHFLDDFS